MSRFLIIAVTAIIAICTPSDVGAKKSKHKVSRKYAVTALKRTEIGRAKLADGDILLFYPSGQLTIQAAGNTLQGWWKQHRKSDIITYAAHGWDKTIAIIHGYAYTLSSEFDDPIDFKSGKLHVYDAEGNEAWAAPQPAYGIKVAEIKWFNNK